VCPICGEKTDGNFGLHLRRAHGEATFREAILAAKKRGMPDKEIGLLYGISFNALEQIITEAYGVNVSALTRPRRIKHWSPKDFAEETTTVWSFRRRGDWATHDGRYRGNWSPYIPREVSIGTEEGLPPAELKGDAATLVYFPPPTGLEDEQMIAAYTAALCQAATSVLEKTVAGSFLAVDIKDLRLGETLHPLGLEVWESLSRIEHLALKEIVILVPEGERGRKQTETQAGFLDIIHRYLIVYRIRHQGL